jgi:outer membrane immunogenic protein
MMMPNSNLIISAALTAILAIGAANAADLPIRTNVEVPPPAAAYNWTGCYLGGYAGGATQSRQLNAWEPASTGGVFPAGTFYDPIGNIFPPHKVDIGEFNYNLSPSVIGGGTLGCNWQGASSSLVFGFEGEGGYIKLSGSAVSRYSAAAGTNDTVASTTIGNWNATLSGRFGYAWDRVLIYLKGGIGFSSINSSVVDACSVAPCSPGLLTATGGSNQPFWAAGLGVEYAFNHSWSIKGEFLNLGIYKKFEVCGPGAAAAAGSIFCGIHSVEGARTYKVGLNYHFDMPILAKY